MNHGIDTLAFDPRLPPPNPDAALGSLVGSGGGGLASSPNVPKPGTSIDPATGKPYAAGMTRAELEAKRALEATSSGSASGESGREQAARQLTGSAAAGEIKAGASGTPTSAPITATTAVPSSATKAGETPDFLEDVQHGLEKVGAAAYGLIPQSLKESIAGVNDPKGKMSQEQAEKRMSASGLLEAAKGQGGKFMHEVRESFDEARESWKKDMKEGTDEVRKSISEFFNEGPVKGGGSTVLATGGIGATGIPASVLASAHTMEGPALTAPTADLAALSLQKDPAGAGSKETSVAAASAPPATSAVPEPKRAGITNETGTAAVGAPPAGSSVSESSTLPVSTGAAGSTLTGDSSKSGGGSYAGLAAPLPATNLFDGAAKGATDLSSVPGVAETKTAIAQPSSTPGAVPQNLSATTGTVTPGAHDRTTSMASITAIRQGHEGDRTSSSPLKNDPVTSKDVSNDDSNSKSVAAAHARSETPVKSKSSGTDSKPQTSLTPEQDPAPTSGALSKDATGAKASSTAANETLGPAGTVPTPPQTASSVSSQPIGTPTSPSSHKDNVAIADGTKQAAGHSPRTSMDSAGGKGENGSPGGKHKHGFLHKLKEKIKHEKD